VPDGVGIDALDARDLGQRQADALVQEGDALELARVQPRR